MSEQKIIKRYIFQKTIGYTASRVPIYNCLVEYMDGSTGITEEIGGKTEAIAPYPERIQVEEESTPFHYMQTKEDAVDHWRRSVQAYNAVKAESDRSIWHDFSGTLTPIYSMIALRQKLDQAVAQHGSDVQDRFTPLNCCILDYANQRLYSVDRLAYFQLSGDQVVLIQEGKGNV